MVSSIEETSQNELKLRKGPHGLGDPEDRSLRKVEIEVLIPKKMREKARKEKCSKEVQDFNACVLDNGISHVVRCRRENSQLKDCLSFWFNDSNFRQLCTDEYLDERSEYRRTGIPKKKETKRMGN